MSTNGNITTPFSPCDQYLLLPGPRVISQNHGTSSRLLITCGGVNQGWLQEPQSSLSRVCQVEWELRGIMQWIHCLKAPLSRTRIQGSQTRHSWAPLLCLVPYGLTAVSLRLLSSGEISSVLMEHGEQRELVLRALPCLLHPTGLLLSLLL